MGMEQGTKRVYKKHFVLFNNNGVISATTPKDWARGHQSNFPDHDFFSSDTTPTVEVIEDFLTTKLKFNKIENNEIVICYQYTSI
jgi:hypothetical protein